VTASMARASTDGLGDAARAAPRPPPRARRSPGAAITFGRRCCYEVWQSGVDGPRVEGVRLCCGARAPPTPSALVVPLVAP